MSRGTPAVGRAALDLTRGVSVTWWYTLGGVVLLELLVVLFWTAAWQPVSASAYQTGFVLAAGLVWTAATVPLLVAYRGRTESSPLVAPGLVSLPLVAAACGATLGAVVQSWVVAALLPVQAILLLNWPRGVRLRLTLALTAVQGLLWFVDSRIDVDGGILSSAGWPAVAVYAMILPSMTVFSLWWWDVLVALDRARVAEARLAATQERLRVATDVHDLQGHHLQVVALQLELAERLMGRGEDAAIEQVRAARVSVAEAMQGTRDLATGFRSVPLGDELANARDLLQAAGVDVSLTVPPDADDAPASVLGPVIRETTTNVLRHGGGHRARLSLVRADDGWRYEIANDRMADAPEAPGGAGLDGVGRRVAEAGGTLDVHRDAEEFAVIVTVPEAPSR